MNSLVSALSNAEVETFQFQQLGEFLSNYSFATTEYVDLVPASTSATNYSRNILMLEPIEVVMLNWPPGVESAIHHHQGFWGYVAVLEGECENIEYKLENGILSEQMSLLGRRGGLIPEFDGVIHKLRNPSKTERAITCHIYYPPLKDFDGMVIFDDKNERTGVLNAKAKTSSWEEPAPHFSSLKENSFRYQSYAEVHKSSHRVAPILPKPSGEEITTMIGSYYNEQAKVYDHFDTEHQSRNKYTQAINCLIAEEVKQLHPLKKVLNLACGTGRRVKNIQELSGRKYELVGVDISPEMCKEARKKGVNTLEADWLSVSIKEQFDAATFLYAFGHLINESQRVEALKKVNQSLRMNGLFFFDLFNREDETEWGPRSVNLFENLKLEQAGYEKGDVFYKKVGGTERAFLHYFSKNEIETLLDKCGFSIEEIVSVGYTKNPGEINQDFSTGCIFVKAKKTRES